MFRNPVWIWAALVLLAAPAQAAPRVRLMLAVPDAAAYEQVMALVHNGQLTALDGEAFVVVGDFADARQGHALGRALQRRLRLPFELVYDPHHPQATQAWLAAPEPALAAAPSTEQLLSPGLTAPRRIRTPARGRLLRRESVLMGQGLPQQRFRRPPDSPLAFAVGR